MARPERDVHQSIWELLKNLRGLDPLKEVFWSQLNYQRVNEPLSRRGWRQMATEALAEDPVLFAGGGSNTAFHVIYSRLASPALRIGLERPVVARLLHDHPYSLFVFSNDAQDHWHFVNVKYGEDAEKRRLFRRITVGPLERLRTASERIAMLDLEKIGPNLFATSPLEIQNRHDQAFDVEAVTNEFFQEYQGVFQVFEKDLAGQTRDKHWGHDYALQFLNRCMFLYFVQRKGWLGGDAEFLGSFWNAYNSASQPQDTFFPKWLSVLFFEAFNNKFHGGHRHFPDAIRNALQVAPFLNGGLFAENDLDRQYDFNVADVRFRQIFTFLERYNFTIREDSPLDQEVAVDPEMIGKVYESLVNLPESGLDERGDAGIFYTPRTEIDLMCRLALVDNLANHLGSQHKNLLYEAVFAIQDDEKQCADVGLAKAGLWPALDEHLHRLTVGDPACGSASFLVGMLYILDDLLARAARQLGREESAYERKKGIIGRSLYGVDVMEWACHVAELRLWLALIIDAEIPAAERHTRRDPLLPHFSFKIRCGDSLVQEVGGISLGHRRGNMEIPKSIKDRLRKLQNGKLGFYSNEPVKGMETETAIKNEEVSIFRDLLAHRADALEAQAKGLMRVQSETKTVRQRNLMTGEAEGPARQLGLAQEEREKQIVALMEEAAEIKKQHAALRHPKDVPLVWDIAFAEVMESDTGGFDIVVGNPPYVRQESIAAPVVNGRQVTEDKKEYKAMLARSVYQAWPTFFGYKAGADTVGRKINAKSDLYTYFYFHGLSLLNDKGSFCFITSNSWLDVGYGADLQEFLLRHGHVKMVIDNQVKRSFASADVNTVIVLLARPDDRHDDGLTRAARFIMFKAPFEQVLSPIIFQEIEDARDRKSTAEYRLCCLTQDRLIEDGSELPEDDEEAKEESSGKTTPRTHGPLIKVAKYIGNKWGGKYLRAPDIYWTVLEKGRANLARVGDLAVVRRGFTSGANDFFYLDDETVRHWKIEKRYLRPLFKGPKDVTAYQMKASDLTNSVFYCTDDKKALKGTNAIRYIEWGEQATVTIRQGARAGAIIRGFHRIATVANRNPWYALTAPLETQIFLNKGINDRHFVCLTDEPTACDQQIYQIKPKDDVDPRALGIVLNCTLTAMFAEIIGRCNFGQGVLWLATYEVAQFPVLNPTVLGREERQTIQKSFAGLARRKPLRIADEVQATERLLLDECVMSFLKLTKGEREGVYEAVLGLVEARLKKAESV